jgi:hypothetical protein
MPFACSLGRKIGPATIDPIFSAWHEKQIARHGLEKRVIGVTAIRADLPRFMRGFMEPAEYAAVRADFEAQFQGLVERSADILVLAGGLPMLLFARGQPLATRRRMIGTASVCRFTTAVGVGPRPRRQIATTHRRLRVRCWRRRRSIRSMQ